jgi:hypothetical protein
MSGCNTDPPSRSPFSGSASILQSRRADKMFKTFLQIIRWIRLVMRWRATCLVSPLGFSQRIIPSPAFMILLAIFSIIVLLMCWLCYGGDCHH